MNSWQPIASAPRKGFTTYIGLTAKHGPVVVDYIPPPSSRSPESWRTVPGRWEATPTHWMPLPDRPTTPPGEKER